MIPPSPTLYGGGETIEDVRELQESHALRAAITVPTIPSASAIGDWLRRMGPHGGNGGMAQINTVIARNVLHHDAARAYALLVDPTIVEMERREAAITYLSVKGYRPVVATLKELGVAIAYDFKAGNDTGGKVAILRQAFTHLPAGKAIGTVLLDAEYHTDDLMAYLDAQGVRWAIAAEGGCGPGGGRQSSPSLRRPRGRF